MFSTNANGIAPAPAPNAPHCNAALYEPLRTMHQANVRNVFALIVNVPSTL